MANPPRVRLAVTFQGPNVSTPTNVNGGPRVKRSFGMLAIFCLQNDPRNLRHVTQWWISEAIRRLAPIIQNPDDLILPPVIVWPWWDTFSWKCLVNKVAMWDFLGMIIGCTSKLTIFCAAEILPPTRSKPSESRNGAKEMMLLPLGLGSSLMRHSSSSMN